MIARIVSEVLTLTVKHVASVTASVTARFARVMTVGAAIVLIGALAPTDVWSQGTAEGVATAERLVEQLRDLPTPLPAAPISRLRAVGEPPPPPQPSEVIRDVSYRELHRLGSTGIAALARAYGDSDVNLRRNVALAFLVLAMGMWPGLEKLNVISALPELTAALADEDPKVRAWSAQAIGAVGPEAQFAVPALIRLLEDDEGSRSSACIGLRGIGPAATSAIPALRRALSDPLAREFARRALIAIEG